MSKFACHNVCDRVRVACVHAWSSWPASSQKSADAVCSGLDASALLCRLVILQSELHFARQTSTSSKFGYATNCCYGTLTRSAHSNNVSRESNGVWVAYKSGRFSRVALFMRRVSAALRVSRASPLPATRWLCAGCACGAALRCCSPSAVGRSVGSPSS